MSATATAPPTPEIIEQLDKKNAETRRLKSAEESKQRDTDRQGWLTAFETGSPPQKVIDYCESTGRPKETYEEGIGNVSAFVRRKELCELITDFYSQRDEVRAKQIEAGRQLVSASKEFDTLNNSHNPSSDDEAEYYRWRDATTKTLHLQVETTLRGNQVAKIEAKIRELKAIADSINVFIDPSSKIEMNFALPGGPRELLKSTFKHEDMVRHRQLKLSGIRSQIAELDSKLAADRSDRDSLSKQIDEAKREHGDRLPQSFDKIEKSIKHLGVSIREAEEKLDGLRRSEAEHVRRLEIEQSA